MAKDTASTPNQPSKYDDWAVQNALDTLIRAEEIKSDKKLMDLVEKEKVKRQAALNKLGSGVKPEKSKAEVLYGKDK